MKSAKLFSTFLYVVSAMLAGGASAMGEASGDKSAGYIEYSIAKKSGVKEFRVGPDGMMEITTNNGCDESSNKIKLSSAEFDSLKNIVESDDFKKLKAQYVTQGIYDGVTIEAMANGKRVLVENHDSPKVLDNLSAALEALQKKYNKPTQKKSETESPCQH